VLSMRLPCSTAAHIAVKMLTWQLAWHTHFKFAC
jgi:hypothetical protein